MDDSTKTSLTPGGFDTRLTRSLKTLRSSGQEANASKATNLAGNNLCALEQCATSLKTTVIDAKEMDDTTNNEGTNGSDFRETKGETCKELRGRFLQDGKPIRKHMEDISRHRKRIH